MTLAELREKLKKQRADAAEARSKAMKDDSTDADVTAFDEAVAAVGKTLGLIKAAEAEERQEGERAAAAAGGQGHNGGPVFAEVKSTPVEKEQRALLGVAAQHKSALILKHHGEMVDPFRVLELDGYGDFAKELKARGQREMQKAGLTSTSSNSVLLPKPVAAEVLPILYPETTFLQGGPQRRVLIGGVYRQPRGTTSATAAYVSEGALKPIGAPAWDDINMSSHKLAGIVYLTNEAAKWPVIDVEAYIRNDLRTVLGLKMDLAAYFGTGVGANPTGIFVRSGITVIDASTTGYFADPKKPTYGELDRFASRMTLALTTNNFARTQKWRWVMGFRARQYLADMRDGNGNAIYPSVETNNTWKGIPILTSTQFNETGGTGTDEGTIGLVDFGYVLFAEEEGMTMRTSTEATLNDGGTLVHLWQQNMSAILAEMQHDFGLSQSKAVVRADKVRWGA